LKKRITLGELYGGEKMKISDCGDKKKWQEKIEDQEEKEKEGVDGSEEEMKIDR